MRPAKDSYRAALALEKAIDTQRAQLAKAGTPVHGAGIGIDTGGPRVIVLLSPDTPAAETVLRQRFGTDTITIINSPGGAPQSGVAQANVEARP